ncbi:GAF domain-containing protein [Haloactinopolyspora alba]|uniref:GAF domain-containing protein n=1 Tax=Haloactinopolyspora alba TaxID=648780 RepID=A0A2P8DWD4_9ACTN|nr:GAF and ANTAR domain-containing protein [Haloactinopolyspora alba]PSL01539.1 GAF domain-containing protein [Haloactinopolyspora alba]
MHDPDATEFANMALVMFNESDVEHTLDRVVEYAQHATACDDAGLMLLHGRGRIETAVATHDRVMQADKLQTDLGEGPCIRAIWNHDVFVVDDTSADERFPEWGPKVAELGLRSILSVRLHTLNSTVGALNLYGNEPGAFDEDDHDVADIFGRHASIALAAAREEDGLRQAIGARHLIGQAQGILMERFGLDADRAFALLRRYSRDNNVKLREVARRIIESGRLSQEP